jgi:hypothetical protein
VGDAPLETQTQYNVQEKPVSIPSMPMPSYARPNLHGGPDRGASHDNPRDSGGTPTTGGSSGGGTRVFGNLQGRDPDLLFAGEKIMINGKEVTVADGQTLSSLAAQHGSTVAELIAENKMDASLLGPNGPNGAYFTPGGPQPAPGSLQNPAHDPLAPEGPNGTYTKEQVPALRAEVQRLQKEGKLAPEKATELLGLLQKIENNGNLSPSEATRLMALMKDLKAAQGSGPAPTTPPPGGTSSDPVISADQAKDLVSRLNKPDGFGWSKLSVQDYAKLRELLDIVAGGGTLSGTQPQELKDLLGKLPQLVS